MTTTGWVIAIVAGYVCGSVPFGFLIGKAHGIDLRTAGSGNIGATNCGRVLGRKWGRVCFVLDFLKGFVPVLGSGVWGGLLGLAAITPEQAGWWVGVAAAAVCGHVFPVWLGFKGGKGVATAFGALMGVWPVLTLTALAGMVSWVIVTAMTRMISMGSVASTLAMTWYAVVIGRAMGLSMAAIMPMAGVTGALALLVLVRHRSNLVRVVRGTESRVGGSRSG